MESKPIKILIFCLLSFTSCHSDEKKQTEKIDVASSYKIQLIKQDSIKVDFLGNPTVHDIDPVAKVVLFMDHRESSEDIYIADFDGNISNSFTKFGDLPDSYGALMGNIKLIGNNEFLVYGYNGFLTFDLEGKLKSVVKYSDFYVPSQSRRSMGFGMENLGDQYLFVNQGPAPKDLEFFKQHKLLSLLDPSTGVRNNIISFPEDSRFLNDKNYFMNSWFPVFTISENQLYVAFGAEPVIYKFSAEDPFNLVSRIPLQLTDFVQYYGLDEPNDIKVMLISMVTGRIINIKKIDDYFLVSYNTGYDKNDFETYFENLPQDERSIFQERMKKKYPNRLAIVDSTGKVLEDFVPDGLEPSSMLLRNGELWMMEKPDEEIEQDYFRLFRVGLKKILAE